MRLITEMMLANALAMIAEDLPNTPLMVIALEQTHAGHSTVVVSNIDATVDKCRVLYEALETVSEPDHRGVMPNPTRPLGVHWTDDDASGPILN